jgi:hypothetical protein
MLVGSACRTVSACLFLAIVGLAHGDDGPAAKKQPPPRSSAPAPSKVASAPPATAPVPVDPAQARAEAEARCKELAQVAEKDLTPTQKAIQELLKERLRWLGDLDNTAKAIKAAEQPSPTPESEAATLKADIERNRAMLQQLGKSPDSVLPEVFRLPPEKVDDAKLTEMRDSIDQFKARLAERTKNLEDSKPEPARQAAELVTLGTARDRARAHASTIETRRKERESAYATATARDDRQVARERLTTFSWEALVEAQQVLLAEANLALATGRAVVTNLTLENLEVQVDLLKAFLKTMGDRYSVCADRQKVRLHDQAAREETLAAKAEDPLEKYAARRRAELLVLEARNIEDGKILQAGASVSELEQTKLANKAEKDFADLKAVVQENRVGGLVALRLNNDFRRISRERALIFRNELALSGAANTLYENALTEAELDYLNDEREDRFERDAFVETLPKARRAEAIAVIDELEKKHKDLLAKRKEVLEKLLKRAEDTHKQVTRRLHILDEQYAFIRTNIFWVRDSEPLGPATVPMARKDAWRLIKATVRLAAEPFDRSLWSNASAEFGIGMVGAVTLPWVIHRARRRLKALLC